MYLEFYGLKELPFALTPDPRFIYFTPSHTEAMASLHYGIKSGKGLIVVTGEVGTGKTTILRWMMNRLDRSGDRPLREPRARPRAPERSPWWVAPGGAARTEARPTPRPSRATRSARFRSRWADLQRR